MVDLASVADVQSELDVLAGHPDGLVRLVARRPGQKEDRWQQIVATPWSTAAGAVGGVELSPPEMPGNDDGLVGRDEGDRQGVDGTDRSGGAAVTLSPDGSDELESLRAEVASLHEAVSTLREELADLRRGLGG